MNPGDLRLLIRGAGELASATAHHLYSQGFVRIFLLDRRFPKAVRRQVCFCEAILDGSQTIQGVAAQSAWMGSNLPKYRGRRAVTWRSTKATDLAASSRVSE